MEEVMDSSARPAPGVGEAAKWAVRWVGLPIVVIAMLPVLVILAGDLGSIEVPMDDLPGALVAALIFLLAGAAAIIIQSTVERHPAWWTHIVILLGTGATISHAMAGGERGISMISLILLGFASCGLIVDAALRRALAAKGVNEAGADASRTRSGLVEVRAMAEKNRRRVGT